MGTSLYGVGVLLFVCVQLLPTSSQWVVEEYLATGQCFTPNRETGTCIAIKSCPHIVNLLKNRPLSDESISYIRRSQCGVDATNKPKVCCPPSAPSIPGSTTSTTAAPGPVSPSTGGSPGAVIPLPDPTICGRFSSVRILGGNVTEIDEYPWMALIEYQKPNGKGFYCGGVLISDRYVLTAAHCIKGKDLPRSWKVISVRLGEYDTSTDNDCVNTGLGGNYCAPTPQDIPIEELIPHEEYAPADRAQINDIALLRLTKSAVFTDFVQPICVPQTQLARRHEGEKLYVAGWGRTENRSESNVKLKLQVPVVPNSNCNPVYTNAGVTLKTTQLCAGGQEGQDSCRGDSGGPLMGLEKVPDGNYNWFVKGIVSFGPSPCGMKGWPGVYTRVNDYVPWINSKIRQ